MGQKVNAIRNPDFSGGVKKPLKWVWHTDSAKAAWSRQAAPAQEAAGGITITTTDEVDGLWSQDVVCRPGEYYRVEATVSCRLDGAGDSAGLTLSVQPLAEGKPAGPRQTTPAVCHAEEPYALRTYYLTPSDVRRLRVSVGVVGAIGSATIHHVRFIKIIEPEEVSHPGAMPAPALALPPPIVAQTVCLCSEQAQDRPIRGILARAFGARKVETLLPSKLRASQLDADALLLPDATPPRAVGSISALIKLAKDRIVVISLPAFEKLAQPALKLRRVEQPDDPIHAKVVDAGFATRGFALLDAIPYAWPGRAVGSFVQNQFRKSPAQRAFCERHGFEVVLESLCDQEVTSDRPVCLHHATSGGGLFVLDIEPTEAIASSFCETNLAVHLLLSILGRVQPALGQYCVPTEDEPSLRRHFREMSHRIAEFVVHDADVPVDEVHEQLITIGREDQSLGLPLLPKPVVLVRSGLRSGDAISVGAAGLWFKQLVRSQPNACPYAMDLTSRLRFAWLPTVASWETSPGWRRTNKPPDRPTAMEMDGGNVRAVIDLVSTPTNAMRVVLPTLEGRYARYASWLPRLFAAFTPGRHFTRSVPDGAAFDDPTIAAWGYYTCALSVTADPSRFADPFCVDMMAHGAELMRIEMPGGDADANAHSIHRTDAAATVLEQVIGLQFGIIAVNRMPARVQLGSFPPIRPGKALVVDAADPMLQNHISQTG